MFLHDKEIKEKLSNSRLNEKIRKSEEEEKRLEKELAEVNKNRLVYSNIKSTGIRID